MILHGNCLDKMREMEENSVDAIVTELNEIEKRYHISINGNVYNIRRCKQVKFCKDWKGYMKGRLYVPELSKNKDKRKPYRVHRLVAMKYLPNFSRKLQVNHKNGIKDDNRLENLEMVTNAQNAKHGWALPSNNNRITKLNRNNKNGKFIKKD